MQRGLTVTAAERASGLCRGSLSRILTGKRGRGLRHETVRRVSRGTKIPPLVLARAFERTIEYNEERQRRVRAAELARLKAELEL
jgi:transcriptional regulator with XRE-family HTH domain